MVKKIYDIKDFVHYLNIGAVKNEELHIVDFSQHDSILLQSGPVTIDFYLIAIKPPLEKSISVPDYPYDDLGSSFMYVDGPHNVLEWDITPPVSGYSIMVSAKFLNRYIKDYNFTHYNSHESLYLTKDEETILLDLFQKAFTEFTKEQYAKEVVLSYTTLLLSYVQTFYDRQFDSRSKIYNSVIESFQKNLESYFNDNVSGLPSVAYFAQKANLSANYFGDLIKHFTGESPIEHIHNHVIRIAKQKLLQTNLSISEISYSLGFDYPTYFTRFFRNKTGIAPKIFRNQ